MNSLKPFVCLSVLLICFTVFPQSETIQVVGIAEEEFEPNEIILQITVNEFKDEKEIVGIGTTEEQIINAMKVLDIPTENLAIVWTSGYKRNSTWKGDIMAENRTYSLKLTSVNQLNPMLEHLEKAKVWSVTLLKVDHTDMTNLERTVLILATQNARKKAEDMMSVLGQQVGEVKSVIEVRKQVEDRPSAYDAYKYRWQVAELHSPMGAVSRAVGDPYEEVYPDLGFMKIKLRYEVSVKFGIN